MDNIEKKLVQAIKPGRVNFSNLIYTYSSHLSAFHRIEFKLLTHDDVELPVTLFMKKTNAPSGLPTIIYNHSHGSSRWESSDLIQHCNNLNLNLCLYDSRGCGEASESYIYFGFKEHIDLLYIILHLHVIYKCQDVILWGRSIGCNTVLQFYQSLLSHEGSFINARITKLMQQNVQSEEEKAELNSFKRYQHSLRILNYSSNMFSSNFNMLIDKYIDDFIEKNIKMRIQDNNFKVEFRILAIVLDSPYDSFSGFIRDNMKKQVAFLSGLISSPVSLYLKSFYKKKIGIDLDKNQNCDLIKRINLNAVMFISDCDELIPLDKFNELIQSFAEKCPKKNKCKVYNTKQKHGKKRPDSMLHTAITHLLQNVNQNNTYRFTHVYVEKISKEPVNMQRGLSRNNSHNALRHDGNVRNKSAQLKIQSAKVANAPAYNGSNVPDPKPNTNSNTSFINVYHQSPQGVNGKRQETSLTQLIDTNQPVYNRFLSSNGYQNANNPKFNERSMSPLQQRYGELGSYKVLELKKPTKNPPVNRSHMPRIHSKPLINNNKSYNGALEGRSEITQNRSNIDMNANPNPESEYYGRPRPRSFNHITK